MASSPDFDVFQHWTDQQLRDFITDSGGNAYGAQTRQQLMEMASRLSRAAEQQVMSTRSDTRAPGTARGDDAYGPTSFYPDVGPPAESSRNTAVLPGMGLPPDVPRVGGPGQVPAPMPPAGGGKKRAMVVGINYFGSSSALGGCINDARCLEYMLRVRFGFRPENILIMTDDLRDPTRIPTRYNIMMGIQWLTTGMRPGDSLVFTYSGHGSRQRDYSGEEVDGYNETLCPVDFRQAGEIVDDELNHRLINPLPQGVKLHAIVDACHSGSVMDLPFSASIQNGRPQWKQEYAFTRGNKGTSGGFAVQIGASQDSQTAADTSRMSGGVSTGAATYAFIQALERKGCHISYGELLAAMDYAIHNALGPGSSGGLPALSGGAVTSILGGLLLGGQPTGHATQRPMLSSCYCFDMNYKLDI